MSVSIRRECCASCGGKISKCSRSGQCRACYVKPLPADFADRAATMRRFELMRHYGVSDIIIVRWAREAGAKPVPRTIMAVPDDFATLAPTMGVMQLRRHYERSERVIRRWIKETGATPLASPPRPARKSRREPYAAQGPSQFIWKGKRLPTAPGRDTTLAGQAAEVLRRFTPVYRCQERGAADPKGSHWRYGNAVLTEDEMFQRARRHGWEARA